MLDVGEELTSVVPIYDGFVLRKGAPPPLPALRLPPRLTPHLGRLAIQKQPAAGALLSNILLSTLKAQTPPVPVTPHFLVKGKEPVEPNQRANAKLRFVIRFITC